jgi:plastocyanin
MIRRGFAVASLGLLVLLFVAPALPASAGGGCHGGVTDGSGVRIDIVNACFTPTVLRVDPGQTVTWTNTDPIVHNITANDWGHYDDLQPGQTFSASFHAPGIYPFACTYHPGMSGAIVVGDGAGAGSGAAVGAGTEFPAAPGPVVADESTHEASSGSLRAWAGGAAIGFVLALALAVILGPAFAGSRRLRT